MHDSSGPHEFDLRSERRGYVSRRIGNRRRGPRSVTEDRRRSNDRRRGALDRREGASDHVRNALHMLGTIPLDEVSPDTAETIGAAKERLGFAIREIDGLLASLRHLGWRLAQHEIPTADD